jgi:hypothetical protein
MIMPLKIGPKYQSKPSNSRIQPMASNPIKEPTFKYLQINS